MGRQGGVIVGGRPGAGRHVVQASCKQRAQAGNGDQVQIQRPHAGGLHPFLAVLAHQRLQALAQLRRQHRAAPPVGIGFYIACKIANVPADKVMRDIWPYLAALMVGLLAIAAVPWFSTALL